MGKKKQKSLDAWCWYCDREFEDDKVLIQHQKAKHYRCPYCPRRLNTAGGLTVHLHQVHKAEPTTIENALPGRESFHLEIYGMVGIPEADLIEWRTRKARSSNTSRGGGNVTGPSAAKRPRVENVVLTPEQLRAQLEAHKALMSGKPPPPGSLPPMFGPPPPLPPPPGMNVPPPGYGQPPPPHGAFPGPPPMSGPPPIMYPPPTSTIPAYPAPSFPTINAHEEAVKTGAKSRMVYTDTSMSPEEKLATTSKYRYTDPDDASRSHAQASSSNGALNMQAYNGKDLQRPAQSYPAVSGQTQMEPPSSHPQGHTAEALAGANQATSHHTQREAEMAQVQAQAYAQRDQDARTPVGATEQAQTRQDAQQLAHEAGGGMPKRARAADLF